MKRITVMTDRGNSQLGEVLVADLRTVLSGRVEIENRHFESLSLGEQLQADIVLVTTQGRALEVQNHVPEARRILVVQRTIRASDAYRIFTLPQDTRVLVVNNLPETTLEMVTVLQQLESHHLQFIPYEEGMDCTGFHVAVTPGELSWVPPGIGTVIDIGHRCIDISTFIEILNRLRLVDREIDQRLFRYAESNVNLDVGVNHQYKELFKKNVELDTVINLAHEGILLLDKQGRVVLHNRALAEMLSLKESIVGCTTEVLPPEVQEMMAQQEGREWIVETRGRSLVVSHKEIRTFGEVSGSYYNFQEITYIRQLEQNFSRKLRERGLVARYTFADLLSRSPRMTQCIELAKRIAQSDFTVLIMGESGTGKELLAQSIHNGSSRSRQPFVAVNCAAVPETLLESELFGYAGGSFTGALREGKEGLFEQANNGTVFLDEIGDMPMMLQAKLLRVLQERQIMRVGSQKVTHVNIRVIAATNRNLRERIQAGLFREDLYYRLNALSLMVPPLRERPEDIFPLLRHFLAQQQREGLAFTEEARGVLQRYGWPGNIRELGNVANHITLMAADLVTVEALPSHLVGESGGFEVEEGLLRGRCGLDRARKVLGVLVASVRTGKGLGRKGIQEVLADQGLPLTEAEVRSVLHALADLGLVHSHAGRRGSVATNLGIQYHNWSINRLNA